MNFQNVNKSDFDNLKYPIHKVDGNVIQHFHDLALYASVFEQDNLPEGLDNNTVIRYIILMYDLGSPGQGIPDLKRRKTWALQCLNIEPPYEKDIDMMLRWGVEAVNRRIITFLMLVGAERYALWKYHEEKLYNLIATPSVLTKENDISDEKAKTDLIITSGQEAEKAKLHFLQGEKSREVDQQLTEFTLQDSLGIRPEEYIREFIDTGDVFPTVSI